jgi:4-diphosphocytidyl-2C-methyl-D-erythritol kinase
LQGKLEQQIIHDNSIVQNYFISSEKKTNKQQTHTVIVQNHQENLVDEKNETKKIQFQNMTKIFENPFVDTTSNNLSNSAMSGSGTQVDTLLSQTIEQKVVEEKEKEQMSVKTREKAAGFSTTKPSKGHKGICPVS